MLRPGLDQPPLGTGEGLRERVIGKPGVPVYNFKKASKQSVRSRHQAKRASQPASKQASNQNRMDWWNNSISRDVTQHKDLELHSSSDLFFLCLSLFLGKPKTTSSTYLEWVRADWAEACRCFSQRERWTGLTRRGRLCPMICASRLRERLTSAAGGGSERVHPRRKRCGRWSVR